MKRKKETRPIRVSAATHKGLLKLAERETRRVSDIADRLLAPQVKAALDEPAPAR